MHKVIEEARGKMDKSIEALRGEFTNIRTGRANPGMLDIVEVEAYGSKMKINQLGNVTAPDPHMLVIDLWDKSLIGTVEKALRASPLGINPSNDGRLIRIPIPPLTEERRRELVKLAAKLAEEARVAVRNVRRHAVDTLKALQKSGEIPEDDAHRLTDEVQKLTDKHIEIIDGLLKTKEADIMEV
ncbi:MAG TPA: ribosome recycling factor [Candidatus Hydrogenedentes bacterium]|nr:ribosome recycling factor [Candidatus Hydrogenedentota bacterium]HOJ67885.1 ribosome recycling factor [Candidatus Hydrogenedentota bacterium]HOK89593.1 ribosome recycling factor [Candidatus Hydrogenedentota bacterium]HOV59811.1 ribosome recycling factor [Candidatus Hydrogenedentota bacterium]